jgi:uncharacterized repeat protein (TIGR03803 family)
MGGTAFEVLHNFTAGAGSFPRITNIDGSNPTELLASEQALYGLTDNGGLQGLGTLFKVHPDGTGFTNLHSFDGRDGGNPSSLALSGDTLYGTTSATVFKVHTDGTGFTTLHTLAGSDGGNPSGLVLLDSLLYGTSSGEASDRFFGPFNYFNVFRVKTDGTGWTNLYWDVLGHGDSERAFSPLILLTNILYGTASLTANDPIRDPVMAGFAFALDTDGTSFTTLHRFNGVYAYANGGNSYYPAANSGGTQPAALVLSGKTLYGTASSGGVGRSGTIFSLSFTPQLRAVHSQTNLVLSWPTNYAGFDYSGYTLESTTNLGSPAWATNLPTPAMINGQKSVTVPVEGTRQFFRLWQ